METITQAAKALGVTSRTLRHYELLGMVSPTRDTNGYRLYSATDIAVLRIIVVLRRLGVPLDSITPMLAEPSIARVHATISAAADAAETRSRANRRGQEALSAILAALDVEFTASTPRLPGALAALGSAIDTIIAGPGVPELPPSTAFTAEPSIEGDIMTTSSTDTASYGPSTPPPGGRLTDVRIVHLPRQTVAASHIVGPDPEPRAWQPLVEFIRSAALLDRKPDARLFGFNHPNPQVPNGPHGYEMWVTIPDDIDVPAPLHRATMPGGTYAAHAIAFGDFHEWAWMDHWLMTSTDWEFAGDPEDAEHMFGTMEEQLNLPAWITAGDAIPASPQLDLLVPVRPKEQ